MHERMSKITVLLVNSRPRIMREVVKQIIERQPDMQIVGEVLDLSALVRMAKESNADVIIVALEDAETLGLRSYLFDECPYVTILSLASQGDVAFIEQLRLGRREIAEPSEANILSAIRHAIRALKHL